MSCTSLQRSSKFCTLTLSFKTLNRDWLVNRDSLCLHCELGNNEKANFEFSKDWGTLHRNDLGTFSDFPLSSLLMIFLLICFCVEEITVIAQLRELQLRLEAFESRNLASSKRPLIRPPNQIQIIWNSDNQKTLRTKDSPVKRWLGCAWTNKSKMNLK